MIFLIFQLQFKSLACFSLTIEFAGANVMKLFTAVSYEFSKLARVSVPCKPFQLSLLLAGKARNLPRSGASDRFFNTAGSCFTKKHKTKLESLARSKH
jgi:hypothetical protein